MKPKVESYIVFARKWRPQTLKDVVGQETVKNQLKEALKDQRIANAYLFAGPRGVGKTSVARILAKALNCEKGITPTPCNKCDQCVSITQGSSMDVIEIDGATYTKVENIRELQEGINRVPFSARKKVYIIDEVHMLSPNAFSALLKTLEEPPHFVVFIFATTEIEKIPETIKSRCQIFHFERISTRDIIKRLELILAEEQGIEMEEGEKEAILEAIASGAEGGLRDAEVTLEQLITLSRGKLKFDHVSQLLGLVEFELLIETLEDLLKKDIKSLLSRVSQLVAKGRDLERFVKAFLSFLRDLLILKAGGSDAQTNYSRERLEQIRKILDTTGFPFLLNIMNNFFSLEERMKSSAHVRFLLEFVFMKLTIVQSDVDIESLLKQIESLEKGMPPSPSRIPPDVPRIATPKSGPNPDLFNGKSNSGNAAEMTEIEPLSTEALNDESQLFEHFKIRVGERKHVLADVLDHTRFQSFTNKILVIQTSPGYDEKILTTADSAQIMEKTLSTLVGESCRVRVEATREKPAPPPAPSPIAVKPDSPDEVEEKDDNSLSAEESLLPEQEDVVLDKGVQAISDPYGDIDVEKYRHLFQESSVQAKFVLDLLKKNPDVKIAVDLIKKSLNAKITHFDGKTIST